MPHVVSGISCEDILC